MICYYCPYWQPNPYSHTGICMHEDRPYCTNGSADCMYGLDGTHAEDIQNAKV